jgi:hypothetical protein
MELTEHQKEALLKLGDSAAGHAFIEPGVIEELLALNLIYWRREEELDFTSVGEKAYNGLTGDG